MTKLLLLGKTGQVGWELKRCLDPLGEVITLGRNELNLENGKAIRRALGDLKPQIIVNAAAYTNVDQAEEESEKARMINAIVPGILAEEAKKLNAFLVHYSTDYVFDGSKGTPYTEEDSPQPINVYGETKLEGENLVKASGVSHLIFRTSWVYSNRGKNFLLTMKRMAKEKDKLHVVDDQVGSPTWSRMVAEATALVLAQIRNNKEERIGTYHLSAAGQISWYGFARAIFNKYFSPEDKYAELVPILSSEYKTLAKRPLFNVLDCNKLSKDYNILLPHWHNTLSLLVDNN